MFSLFENAVVVIALLFFATGGFSFLFVPRGDGMVIEGNTLAMLVQVAIYAFCGVCMIRCRKKILIAGSRIPIVFALILFALLSTLWSDFPLMTFRRSLILLATTIFGVYFGTRFQRKQQLALLATSLGFIALVCLFSIVLFPSYGISADAVHAGDWQGIFDTKNGLAKVMSLSCLVFALLPRSPPFLRYSGLLLSTSLVIASGSRTGIAVCVLLMAGCLIWRGRWWRWILLGPTVLIAMLSCLLLANQTGYNLLASLGRDEALTGRRNLWTVVLIIISGNPWLGHGFSSVWLQPDGSPVSSFIIRQIGWAAPHSHNGFLDLALELGLVGIAMFLGGLIAFFIKAAVALRQSRTAEDLWPLMYLLFLPLYNLTESSLLIVNGLYWALYVSVTVSVSSGSYPIYQRWLTGRVIQGRCEASVSVGAMARGANRA